MAHLATARIALTLALVAGGTGSALSGGWWDRCDCYGPPYGNYDPPPIYVYDHRTGPTWTGNGWAYLPVGTYQPVPPGYAPYPPPVYRVDATRERSAYPRRRHRPLK